MNPLVGEAPEDHRVLLGFLCAGVVAIILVKVVSAAKVIMWKAEMRQKYGNTQVAENIINKVVWVGETSEQLSDSLGTPVKVDDHVLKTKRKETWKYAQRGRNRFALRITVENGVVVGWDEKL